MQLKDNTTGPPVKGDDPHESYLAAIADWERADRERHKASIGVACGRVTADELAKAAARMGWAENTAIIERHRAGQRWFDGLRFCIEDDELQLAVRLYVVALFREEVEGLTQQIADLKAQLADVEDLLAQGVSA